MIKVLAFSFLVFCCLDGERRNSLVSPGIDCTFKRLPIAFNIPLKIQNSRILKNVTKVDFNNNFQPVLRCNKPVQVQVDGLPQRSFANRRSRYIGPAFILPKVIIQRLRVGFLKHVKENLCTDRRGTATIFHITNEKYTEAVSAVYAIKGYALEPEIQVSSGLLSVVR